MFLHKQHHIAVIASSYEKAREFYVDKLGFALTREVYREAQGDFLRMLQLGDTVIELDGSQHYEAEGKQKDAQRDAFLRSQGLTVLRYSNADINKNFRGVCEDILNHLHKPSP